MNVWTIVAGVFVSLLVLWGLMLIALWRYAPKGLQATEALRILPDLLRLIRRLTRDPAVPRGARVRLWFLIVYLVLPIDLVPDFIPVLGYADDAIVVALVLRSIVRTAGPEAITRNWAGSDSGLHVVFRLAGLNRTTRDI